MQIELINVHPNLITKGIDLLTGAGVDLLCMEFQMILPCQSWNYDFSHDKLTIQVPDGTVIPSSLSEYGEVVLNDSSMG